MTKALLNPYLFTQTDLDSGALTMLGAVVHQLRIAGVWAGSITRHERVTSDLEIRVDERGARQLNVDLSSPYVHSAAASDCGCVERSAFVVHPAGYVVFYVSRGAGGYAVTLRLIDSPSEEGSFDSRALADGDMFAATVLRPGEYDVRNALSDASAHLVVHALDHRPASEPQPDPVEIQCRPDAFNPSEIEIVQGIGQSYQCVAPSRITITPVASAT